MTGSKIPILPIVRQAYRVMGSHWRTILQIAWLPLAIVCLASAWTVTYLPDAELSSLAPDKSAALMVPFAVTNVVATILFFLTGIMIFSGILRLLFRNQRPLRPYYLHWDMDEWRIAGASVAQTLILVGFALVAIFALSIAFTIVLLMAVAFGTDISFLTQATESGDLSAILTNPLSATLVLFFGLMFILALIWIAVRMWFFVPLSFLQEKVALRDAWRLSRGHVGRLLGIAILTALPIYLLSTILIAFLDAAILGGAFAVYAEITAWSPGLTVAPDINPHDRLGSLIAAAILSQVFRSALAIAVFTAQACSYQWILAQQGTESTR